MRHTIVGGAAALHGTTIRETRVRRSPTGTTRTAGTTKPVFGSAGRLPSESLALYFFTCRTFQHTHNIAPPNGVIEVLGSRRFSPVRDCLHALRLLGWREYRSHYQLEQHRQKRTCRTFRVVFSTFHALCHLAGKQEEISWIPDISFKCVGMGEWSSVLQRLVH